MRARKSKFICINDNIQHPTAQLDKIVRHFFEALYPMRSPFELPPGARNPTLYTDEYRRIYAGWRSNALRWSAESTFLRKNIALLLREKLIEATFSLLRWMERENEQQANNMHHVSRRLRSENNETSLSATRLPLWQILVIGLLILGGFVLCALRFANIKRVKKAKLEEINKDEGLAFRRKDVDNEPIVETDSKEEIRASSNLRRRASTAVSEAAAPIIHADSGDPLNQIWRKAGYGVRNFPSDDVPIYKETIIAKLIKE